MRNTDSYSSTRFTNNTVRGTGKGTGNMIWNKSSIIPKHSIPAQFIYRVIAVVPLTIAADGSQDSMSQ